MAARTPALACVHLCHSAQAMTKKLDKLMTMDPKEITFEMVHKKLMEIVSTRGRRGTDRQEQVWRHPMWAACCPCLRLREARCRLASVCLGRCVGLCDYVCARSCAYVSTSEHECVGHTHAAPALPLLVPSSACSTLRLQQQLSHNPHDTHTPLTDARGPLHSPPCLQCGTPPSLTSLYACGAWLPGP